MKLFWLLALVHSVLSSSGRGSGGGGVDINLGPFVIRAGGGGSGGGFGGFYLGTQSPDGHTPLIQVNAGGGADSGVGGGGGGGFQAGGGGAGLDRTGITAGGGGGNGGGGFGGVSIGNFLRVLGWGGGGPGGRNRRQVEAETTTSGSILGGGGGGGGGGGNGGFNISGLFGSGGLSELGLGGPEPDPRFKAPGQSPEDALLFNYDERPKYDKYGNVITPINSRYQILKVKLAPSDTTKKP